MIMNEQKKLLTIRISGAHFSACEYDLRSKEMVPGTYQRIPHSRKADKTITLKTWRSVLRKIPLDKFKEIGYCAVAVPNNFLDENGPFAGWHNDFSQPGLKIVIAELTGLSTESIKIYSNAGCFLRGALINRPEEKDDFVLGMPIGADFTVSIKRESSITDLFLVNPKLRRDFGELTTCWIMKRYYQLTGISVLNVKDLNNMYHTHSMAKKVMTEFCDQLSQFFIQVKNRYPVKSIILAGELNFSPQLFATLLKAAHPSKLLLGNPVELSTHLGACLFFAEDRN